MRDPFGFYRPEPTIAVAPAAATPVSAPIPDLAEGMVRALISTRPIEAYTRVTREDLFNPRTANFAYQDVKKEFAEENNLRPGYSQIVGRVMSRPKRVGFAFKESDFLPKGTRPGLAAGIPAGKRALRIEVEFVRGIIGLEPGDRFDVVAARTVEAPVTVTNSRPANSGASTGQGAPLGVYASLLPRPGEAADGTPVPPPARPAQAEVEVIVQGGVVVSGLETRLIPTSSTGLATGQITGTRPVQEMVVALAPEEVAPLMGAMRLQADLTCVARSGRPEDDAESVTPGLEPDFKSAGASEPMDASAEAGSKRPAKVRVVEKIVGGVRTLVAVPSAPESKETDPR